MNHLNIGHFESECDALPYSLFVGLPAFGRLRDEPQTGLLGLLFYLVLGDAVRGHIDVLCVRSQAFKQR